MTRSSFARAALLATALAGGCSLIADPDKLKPDVPATAEAFCATLKARIVQHESICMGVASAAVQQDGSWPACADWSRAVTAGRAAYDRLQAYDCLALTAWPGGCADWFSDAAFGYPVACQQALVGLIPVGAGPASSCHVDAECGPWAYCDSSPAVCPSHCRDFAPDGADCSTARCYPGRACAVSAASPTTPVCQPRLVLGAVGDPCAGAADVCVYDLACRLSSGTLACAVRSPTGACSGPLDCTRDGLCPATASPTCQQARPVGATCTAGSLECVAGAACDATGHCQLFPSAPSAAGSCGPRASGENVGCLGGTCVATACVASATCALP